jgi:hypothetical protein
MSVIKFTKKDKLASAIMPAGYFSFEITEIGEPQRSGSGKSFNLHSRFTVIDDVKFEGKELRIAFNTSEKMAAPSIMGTMYLMPHTYLQQLYAATANTDILEVPDDIDLESLKGGKFDGKVEKLIHDGIVMNTISAFLPYETGKDKQIDEIPF